MNPGALAVMWLAALIVLGLGGGVIGLRLKDMAAAGLVWAAVGVGLVAFGLAMDWLEAS